MKKRSIRALALVLALTMMLSCSVNVFAAAERHNIEYELAYGDDKVDLAELLEEELSYEYDWDTDVRLGHWYFWTDDSDEEYYDEDLDYGRINNYNEYVIDLSAEDEDELYEEEVLYENYIYYEAEDSDGYEYYGRIEIIIVDEGNGGTLPDSDENTLPAGAKYRIDSVSVRSPQTNSKLDAIPPNSFYAEVEVTNLRSTGIATLLLAVYAETGEMIDLGFLYADPQRGQTVTFGTLVDNPDGRACKVKAFLWSSLTNPVPLAEAKAFPEELPDLSGDVVLGYSTTPGLLNGMLVNAVLEDGTTGALAVTAVDGLSWDQAQLAVPDFYLHRLNESSQSTLTTLKTAAEYQACGIYAGLVSKYTDETNTVTLDYGVELASAVANIPIYNQNFVVQWGGFGQMLNQPCIFYAPEGEALYGVHVSGEALEELYVKLGGTLPEKGEPWEGVIVANEYADLHGLTPLKKGQTRIRYTDEAGDEQYLTFTNWSTDLTDIGEYRSGTAEGTQILTVSGKEQNTEFQTGMEVTAITTSANVGGIKIDDDAQYFINFEEVENGAFNVTGNGDWLRVVDNDGDGYAEYAFLTTFEMTEVYKVAKDDTITLANGVRSDAFALSDDVATGDIVLYTAIDGREYVEKAESVVGKVEKYTYKTRSVTVGGVDYAQSDIDFTSIEADYFSMLEDAARNTEYTFYLDFFGNIRIYAREITDVGEPVLLTDAYYETGRSGVVAAVDAYLNGAITETDVRWSTAYTDVEYFIEADANNNKWGQLITYGDDAQAWTNIARATTDEAGVMSLYTAQTWKYNSKGEKTSIKADYIDLMEQDVEAGQTTYSGVYDGTEVRVQATKDTVFYYVDGDLNIQTATGYKNSLDVIDAYVDINAMYAVATNAASDANGERYWVADVVVIETEYPAFTLSADVVLGYSVVSKTVSDYAYLDVIGTNGTLDSLNVTNINGFNIFDTAELVTPAFYYNTENEDGDSHIRSVVNYPANGIYAGIIDRASPLYEYVVMTNGDILYFDENTVVYDMYAGTRYTAVTTVDANGDALTLNQGASYILVVDTDDTVIYAVLVESADDVAAGLYTEISGEAVGPNPDPEPGPAPDTGAEKPLVLLTDAYFETNRNGNEAAVDAYLNGAITEVDVNWDNVYTDVDYFIEADAHNNRWGVLTEYWEDAQAWTNLAAYTTDENGVMSLYTATAYNYNELGEAISIKRDYIDLNEQDVEAGETTYYGMCDGTDVRVQASQDTVFYYVDGDLNIQTATGYKNSLDVIDAYVDINAMYAVATAAEDGYGESYWVADAIVVETEYKPFRLGSDPVLAYNVAGKTADNSVSLEVIDKQGELEMLNVTNGNGFNTFDPADIPVPAFYFNSEVDDGDSHIRMIAGNWSACGIYTVKVDRVNKLMDYVSTMDGSVFYIDETTTVYDLKAKTNSAGHMSIHVTAEDDYAEALTLDKGEAYILLTDGDDTVVYAIWVEGNDDVAAQLYAEISGEAVDPEAAELAAAKEAAKAEVAMRSWTDAQKAAAMKAIDEAEYGTVEELYAMAAAVVKAMMDEEAAAEAAKVATVTIDSGNAVLVNGVAYTAPMEAKIGDVLTLEFSSEVIVSATGAAVVKGETLKVWTATVTANTVVITVAQ